MYLIINNVNILYYIGGIAQVSFSLSWEAQPSSLLWKFDCNVYDVHKQNYTGVWYV